MSFSRPPSTVKPLPLSPLEPQSSTLVGGAGERQALELRVRAVEEENQALRRELSRPPRSPSARLHGGGHHGNQSRTHSEEGTGDNEGQKAAAVRNSTDCVQQPAVDKCEVGFHLRACSARADTTFTFSSAFPFIHRRWAFDYLASN